MSATLFPCWPAMKPKMEKITNPANTLVKQLVREMIRASLRRKSKFAISKKDALCQYFNLGFCKLTFSSVIFALFSINVSYICC